MPDLPYCIAYPLVRAPNFTRTSRGFRNRIELAEMLFLSPFGLDALEHSGGRGYGPKWLRKPESGIPAGVYRDADVAHWLIYGLSKTGQWWLAYYQHTFPSEASQAEAEISAQRLMEAYRVLQK